MKTRHPMGLRGVASKLKGPLKSSQAEGRGDTVDCLEKVEGEFGLREEFVP